MCFALIAIKPLLMWLVVILGGCAVFSQGLRLVTSYNAAGQIAHIALWSWVGSIVATLIVILALIVCAKESAT